MLAVGTVMVGGVYLWLEVLGSFSWTIAQCTDKTKPSQERFVPVPYHSEYNLLLKLYMMLERESVKNNQPERTLVKWWTT